MTYNITIDGTDITVTLKEVESFYKGLDDSDYVNECRANHIGRLKYIADKCMFEATNHFYIGLIMAGQLSVGKILYFRVRLTGMWYVTITRREDGLYVVEAFTWQNYGVVERTFGTLRQAILHCANGFNENGAIKDKYSSVEELCGCNTTTDQNRAVDLLKAIEKEINIYGFDFSSFAQAIGTMHPTVQQTFFRLIKESILFMGDDSRHFIDDRNRASHEISKRLAEILCGAYIPHV